MTTVMVKNQDLEFQTGDTNIAQDDTFRIYRFSKTRKHQMRHSYRNRFNLVIQTLHNDDVLVSGDLVPVVMQHDYNFICKNTSNI